MRFCVTAAAVVVIEACLIHALRAETVVRNDNITFRPYVTPFGFELSVSRTAVNEIPEGSNTFAYFQYDPLLFKVLGSGSAADEGSDWYVVSPGALFSRGTVAEGLFPVVLSLPENDFNNVYVGPDDFYLGVRTGVGYGYPANRTAYGWVHFAPQPDGRLMMLENVMSYDNYGIVVGTTDIIPEPAAGSLAFICSVAALAFRRHG